MLNIWLVSLSFLSPDWITVVNTVHDITMAADIYLVEYLLFKFIWKTQFSRTSQIQSLLNDYNDSTKHKLFSNMRHSNNQSSQFNIMCAVISNRKVKWWALIHLLLQISFTRTHKLLVHETSINGTFYYVEQGDCTGPQPWISRRIPIVLSFKFVSYPKLGTVTLLSIFEDESK